MLRLFVERLMNIRCCCEQGGAAYRTVLYPNHYSEAPAYKPGLTHYMADSISRLVSTGSDSTAFDDAIQVFAA